MFSVGTLALKVEDLTKAYGNKVVLKDLNLSLATGQTLALLGRNGAGKTTLLNTLSHIIEPTSGRIQILPRAHAPQKLTLVPQENNCLYSDTLLNTLLDQAGLYGISRPKALLKAEFLMKKFHLWKRRFDKIHQLSTGQRKIIMLLRSLMIDPDILLMDELTAGLDYFHKKFFLQELKSLNLSGISIIISSHQLEDIYEMCDSFAILNNGHIQNFYQKENLPEHLSRKKLIIYVNEPISNQLPASWEKHGLSIQIPITPNTSINQIFKQLSQFNLKFVDFDIRTVSIESFLIMDNESHAME